MQGHHAVSEQLQRPTLPPLGCRSAGLGDQARLALLVQLGRATWARPLGQGRQALSREAAARALDGGPTGLHLVHNGLVIQPGISFEQDPGARELAGGMLPTVQQQLQTGTILFGQCNVIFFSRHGCLSSYWKVSADARILQRVFIKTCATEH